MLRYGQFGGFSRGGLPPAGGALPPPNNFLGGFNQPGFAQPGVAGGAGVPPMGGGLGTDNFGILGTPNFSQNSRYLGGFGRPGGGFGQPQPIPQFRTNNSIGY